jgi:uncharacterized membrane protein
MTRNADNHVFLDSVFQILTLDALANPENVTTMAIFFMGDFQDCNQGNFNQEQISFFAVQITIIVPRNLSYVYL